MQNNMPWVIWTSCHQTSICPQERPGKLAFQTEKALFSLHDVSFLKVKARTSTKSMELRSRLFEFVRGHSIKLDDKSGLQGQSQRRCARTGHMVPFAAIQLTQIPFVSHGPSWPSEDPGLPFRAKPYCTASTFQDGSGVELWIFSAESCSVAWLLNWFTSLRPLRPLVVVNRYHHPGVKQIASFSWGFDLTIRN